MATLKENKSLLEILKANLYITQCTITILKNIISDYPLQNVKNKNFYKDIFPKNLSEMKDLTDSLGLTIQFIIDSIDIADVQEYEERCQ